MDDFTSLVAKETRILHKENAILRRLLKQTTRALSEVLSAGPNLVRWQLAWDKRHLQDKLPPVPGRDLTAKDVMVSKYAAIVLALHSAQEFLEMKRIKES